VNRKRLCVRQYCKLELKIKFFVLRNTCDYVKFSLIGDESGTISLHFVAYDSRESRLVAKFLGVPCFHVF
jgi:hypothetical protein